MLKWTERNRKTLKKHAALLKCIYDLVDIYKQINDLGVLKEGDHKQHVDMLMLYLQLEQKRAHYWVIASQLVVPFKSGGIIFKANNKGAKLSGAESIINRSIDVK